MWCNVGFTQTLVKDYLKYRKLDDKKMNEFLDISIISIGAGVHWTNTMLKIKGLKPLYCQPKGLTLGARQFIVFTDEEIEYQKNRGTLKDDDKLGMFIPLHLQRIFPCKD